MLISLAELTSIPVMSLQTGVEVAYTVEPIVDPSTLDILAYELDGESLDTTPAFLRVQDIRELSDLGFIIDSSDSLSDLDDFVTHADLYKNPVQIEGMRVLDDRSTLLGKVEAAIMDTQTFRIEQLQVKPPLFKRFMETNLLISRAQIKEITDDTIIVRSATLKDKVEAKTTRRAMNPFRNTTPPQPESIKPNRR